MSASLYAKGALFALVQYGLPFRRARAQGRVPGAVGGASRPEPVGTPG